MRWRVLCFVVSVTLVAVRPEASIAQPGVPFVAERARLAAMADLRPLVETTDVPGRWETHPRSDGGLGSGPDRWSLTLDVVAGIVASEAVTVRRMGGVANAGSWRPLVARLFGASLVADLEASSIVGSDRADPAIVTLFRRGKRYGFRSVSDERNGMFLVEIVPATRLRALMRSYGVASQHPAPRTVALRDVLSVVEGDGRLVPLAALVRGELVAARPSDGAASARVHIIYRSRTIATLPVTATGGVPRVALSPALGVSQTGRAFASPTLAGSGAFANRPASQNDRAAVLAVAATLLRAPASALHARNVTVLRLDGKRAFAATVVLMGAGQPRNVTHLFLIAEKNVAGTYAPTLAVRRKVVVTEPLLREISDDLSDSVELPAGPALIVHDVGYDADTYSIYTRAAGSAWKLAATGGGTAS